MAKTANLCAIHIHFYFIFSFFFPSSPPQKKNLDVGATTESLV